jgi:phage baseplate assembly protein W
MDQHEFVGVGWQFPIAPDPTGAIALVGGDADVERAIYLILATEPGERPMRPEFGCRLQQFFFEPVTSATAALLAHEVKLALRRWEPRIDIDSVVVTADPVDASTLWVDIAYRIRDTYDTRNLVFPFYVIPDDEP